MQPRRAAAGIFPQRPAPELIRFETVPEFKADAVPAPGREHGPATDFRRGRQLTQPPEHARVFHLKMLRS